MLQVFRQGFQSLKKTPVVTTVTIVTLAIGIGLNSGMFNVVNGMLFRARVEKDPSSFVQLVSKYSGRYNQGGEARAFTPEDFEAFRNRSQSLSEAAGWRDVHLRFESEGASTLALLTTCGFFQLYGLDRPKQGRLFSSEECSDRSTAHVVLISEELWRGRLSSAPDIVGKSILLDDKPFAVIGVIPEGFSGRLRGPGIWLPWTVSGEFYEKSAKSDAQRRSDRKSVV